MNKYIDILLVVSIFLVAFFTHLPLADTELLSPDASGYLDMGRNLFTGKGAVSSYNIYQLWPGRSHPFLPYMQPLYPMFAGFIWVFLGLKAVIGFNIGLFVINCALVYLILKLATDVLTGFLIALFMCFSTVLVYTAIWPWTEQLHLLFLLSAVYLYLKYEKAHFWVGVIWAISCLVRAAGLYNVFAFGLALIVLKGFSKQSLGEYFKIALGFLTVLVPYEVFCFIMYGTFYPEYLSAAKTYRMSELAPGAYYTEGLPVLNMPLVSDAAGEAAANIRRHLAGFFAAFGTLKFVLILAPLYTLWDLFRKKTALFVIFLLQGLCAVLFYSVSLAWLPDIEAERYSLIPFLALGSLGLLAVRNLLNALFGEKFRRGAPIVFLLIILPLHFMGIRHYSQFRGFYTQMYPQKYKVYTDSRDRIYKWIRNNTEDTDLVASHFLADAFLHQRPFVALPSGRALTIENLSGFLEIYQPEYVLVSRPEIVEFLMDRGFVEAAQETPLILLKGA